MGIWTLDNSLCGLMAGPDRISIEEYEKLAEMINKINLSGVGDKYEIII